MGQRRISAAIIGKDEANRIEGTIASVGAIAQKVYYLDLGSSDRSCEKAQQQGAKVFHASWEHDFSQSRNQLLDLIAEEGETDLVLWVKPGELFDSRTIEEFQQFIATTQEPNTAYLMVLRRYSLKPGESLQERVSIFQQVQQFVHTPLLPFDGFSDWNEETVDLRFMPLYGTEGPIRFSGRVRETALPSLSLAGIQLSAAPGRILDALEEPDMTIRLNTAKMQLDSVLNRVQNGFALSEDEILTKADAFVEFGEIGAARELYSLLINEVVQSNLRLETFYKYYATFSRLPDQGGEKLQLLVKGLECFPLDLQLLTFLGTTFSEQQNYEMSIRVLETAIEHGQISLDVPHRQCIRELAIAHLSLIYRITGQPEKAIALLEHELTESPTHTQFARLLFDLYIVTHAETSAHELAAQYWGGAELDRIRTVMTGAIRGSSGAWTAALISLESAYEDGCRDPYCLRWYSLALLSNLKLTEALPILEEWLQVDPGNVEAQSFRFAASQPERFYEILSAIRHSQAESLGFKVEQVIPTVTQREQTEQTQLDLLQSASEMDLVSEQVLPFPTTDLSTSETDDVSIVA
ncbi:MAG: tetratricopeptide repeat-containing glycosyltransferase [Thermoguttaceae bacterium]